jgi:phosphoglucan,water dikinase
MVHIGNQTSCWAATPTEPFDYAVAQGFDAFEWFPDKKPEAGWDEEDLTTPARKSIAEDVPTRRMRLSVHARWQANLLTPDGIALFWKDLDLARDLGAALINIHLEHGQGVPAFIQAILPLIGRTAEAGVQLSIENTPLHSPELFNELFAQLRSLDSVKTSHVGMCLDLGHANLCAAARNNYLGFVDRLDPNLPIIHLHLHENWGDSDSHLPLFTGPSSRDDSGIRQLVARLKKRGYSGSMILEQWPHPPSLLNNARDRLLQLWGSAEFHSAVPQTSSLQDISFADDDGPSQEAGRKEAPPTDLVRELVQGDRTRQSWREKLNFIRDLLASDTPAVTSDQLVDIAIYLRFLGTGEIPCSEDGRHFRPAQHARLASQIQDRLAKLTTPENQFIVRKIYPWLPSSAQTFQRPEPLTRIRDIAHRNDIPQDLKREIKTTLQNKLHRCAGPEDLATSTALLERITAPGTSYSSGFVDQFKIFHEELKEFFNAQSLEQRLSAVGPMLQGKGAELIQQFLKQKTAVAAGLSPAVEPGVSPGGLSSRKTMHPGGETPPSTSGGTSDATPLLATFRSLTDLRQVCLELVMRKPGAETEAILLADIALEDFAFVLLSEIVNAFDRPDAKSATECQTEALTLALQNLVLSGVDPIESTAVQNELRAWGTLLPSAKRTHLLRQKATLLRCRRLAEDFGDRVVALFSSRAAKLGRALGVAEHAIRVFAEADIRSHIVFQISKLTTNLLRNIRQLLKLPPWDVLVPGKAAGRATAIHFLNLRQADIKEPTVALLGEAIGDEEIPTNVTGIVLAHELPYLSHLAVRARQARVVFVGCEEPAEFERLQGLAGQFIALNATPDKIEWNKVDQVESAKQRVPASKVKVPTVRLTKKRQCIALEEVTPENGGGKAAGVRRLAELSRQPAAGFTTPEALIIPFGVMEEVMRAAPAIEAKYREAVKELDSGPAAEVESATARLRELMQHLSVPDEIISQIQRKFRSLLIVRSSANAEDTEELAGAGLYESVPNVSPSDAASAIRKVWASLWTSRATLSRRQAGIPHDQVHMALLIQELLSPDLAFVLHTVNPVTRDPHTLYGEIVLGLGETLVSAAAAGEPYRFTCTKQSGEVEILAFANFSKAARPVAVGVSAAVKPGILPGGSRLGQSLNSGPESTEGRSLDRESASRKIPGGGTPLSTSGETRDATSKTLSADISPSPLLRGEGRGEELFYEIIDYSSINLSRDPAALESVCRRLCKIGSLVEQALAKPQDIEGVVIQDKIYLVQTRPQQGL